MTTETTATTTTATTTTTTATTATTTPPAIAETTGALYNTVGEIQTKLLPETSAAQVKVPGGDIRALLLNAEQKALLDTPTNAAGGLVVAGADGKVPATVLPAGGSGGGSGSGSGSPVEIGEIKFWHRRSPPAGWKWMDGSVLTNASTSCPLLLEHLSSPDGAWKCVSEADWQALSTAASGRGGVLQYVYNSAADTVRLPDTRGDSLYAAELAGDVGKWQGDAIREMWGYIGTTYGVVRQNVQGVLRDSRINSTYPAISCPGFSTQGNPGSIDFRASNFVPTAPVNRPRRFAVLHCVYIGQPL